MKKHSLRAFGLALAFLIFTAFAVLINLPVPASEEALPQASLLRLHIRANSDSERDQELKLLVRDELFLRICKIFEGCDDVEECQRLAEEHAPELTELAEAVLLEHGESYGASYTLGLQYFSERELRGESYPEGYYPALVIELGAGEGENWWCLLFPSVLPDGVIEDGGAVEVGIAPSDYREIVENEEGPFVVRFKLLELILDLFDD